MDAPPASIRGGRTIKGRVRAVRGVGIAGVGEARDDVTGGEGGVSRAVTARGAPGQVLRRAAGDAAGFASDEEAEAMVQTYAEPRQEAFANAVAGQLRAARIRQKLTQSELAGRTGGRVSKAALANYETRQRSLRIDVFWILVRVLGEDPAALLAAAERESGYASDASDAPISVNAAAIQASTDARLAPVQRWFTLRLRIGTTSVHPASLTLDATAVNALAELMGTTPADCRRLLIETSAAGETADQAVAG